MIVVLVLVWIAAYFATWSVAAPFVQTLVLPLSPPNDELDFNNLTHPDGFVYTSNRYPESSH